MSITFGPEQRNHSPISRQPLPGVLLREPCPPADQVRFYAVDTHGLRCFEVTVRASLVTPELISRLRDDAAMIACPRLSLLADQELPPGQPKLPRRRP